MAFRPWISGTGCPIVDRAVDTDGALHRSLPANCHTGCATVANMAVREKRSVSLDPDLATDIDRAAAETGTTFSGWLAETAAHRLRLEEGRRGIQAWEAENGPLTDEERAEGRARARRSLGRA